MREKRGRGGREITQVEEGISKRIFQKEILKYKSKLILFVIIVRQHKVYDCIPI